VAQILKSLDFVTSWRLQRVRPLSGRQKGGFPRKAEVRTKVHRTRQIRELQTNSAVASSCSSCSSEELLLLVFGAAIKTVT